MPAGRITASTIHGSWSNRENAFPGQSLVQLVYGLGKLKVSASTSRGR